MQPALNPQNILKGKIITSINFAFCRAPNMTYNRAMIPTWYSLPLGDGMTADQPSEEIQAVFRAAFESAGLPAEMAIFKRHESEGRLHCEVVAYFSPAASSVAKLFDAEPCQRPSRSGLGLLAGDESSWSMLFPESES